nr:hypothetical protein [Bradyrhizobium sp. CCBAU 53340]
MSADGRWVVSYNGEIYNADEIRPLSFDAWRRQWAEHMHRRPARASNAMAITAGR